MKAGGGRAKGRGAENERVRYLKAHGFDAIRNPQYSPYGKLPDITAIKKKIKINAEVKWWAMLPSKKLMSAYGQAVLNSKPSDTCMVFLRENRTELKVEYQGRWFVLILMDDLMELIG